MKKLIKLAASGAVAALLISSMSFAQTQTQQPAKPTTVNTETVTVTKTTAPKGFKVCYIPSHRHVEGSRIVERCGPFGCRTFRISREFEVIAYEDCHVMKDTCSHQYKTFGWYPTRFEAHDAADRCMHTYKGEVPSTWRISTAY